MPLRHAKKGLVHRPFASGVGISAKLFGWVLLSDNILKGLVAFCPSLGKL